MNAPFRHATSPLAQRFSRADPVADRVRAHLPLVRRIAWHVHGRAPGAVEIEELVQTGMVALVEAAQAYEDRGHAFATYAQMRVRGSMIDLIRRNATICRSAIVRRRQIEAARRQLETELGRAPDEGEVAAAMGIPATEWRALADATETIRHESIDEVYSEHSMWFADDSEAADKLVDRKDMAARLTAALTQLPIREAQVLQLYFVEELNLDEIGETLGVGAARVCQIKKAALDRVRGLLAS
jgi:RNA polymerase sigma factor FliA